MNEAKGLSGRPAGATEAARQDDAAPAAPTVFEDRPAAVADQRTFDEKLDRDRGLNAGQAPETRHEVRRSLGRLTGTPPRRGTEHPRSAAPSVEPEAHRGEGEGTHGVVPTDQGRPRATDRPETGLHPGRLARDVARSGDARDDPVSRAVPVADQPRATAVRHTAAGPEMAPSRRVPPVAPTPRRASPVAPTPRRASPVAPTPHRASPVAPTPHRASPAAPTPRQELADATRPVAAEPSQDAVRPSRPVARPDATGAGEQPASAVPSGPKYKATRRAQSLDDTDPARAERETTVPEHAPRDRAAADAAVAATTPAVPGATTDAPPVDVPGAVAAAADRAAVAREVVERVLVSLPEAGAPEEVRVTLASSVLDGSSFRLSREAGELKVVFEAATEGAMRYLADSGDSLRQALASRLPGELVRVDVRHEGGAAGDDPQGRARQRYVAPDDDAAGADTAPARRRDR